MKLRVFLPGVERPEASTRFAWTLLDARRGVMRADTTTLDQVPRADEVEAILPATRVLFARLKLPRVSTTTIRELLPYAVEDRLLDDPAHIHAVAGRRDANGETTVAVVDREWLAAMVEALRRAGLAPRRAWSESALVVPTRGEWHVLLGAQRGVLVDDRDVSVAFDRSVEVPLALRIALDEAAARGERPTRIVLHLEDSAALPDVTRWQADTGVTFVEGEPWDRVRLAEPSLHAIDLLQGDFARRRSRLSPGVPRAALALAGVIAVLQLAFVAADTWRLERERQALEARREAIFRAAFPEAKTVVDPELQMARNLESLRRSRGLASGDDFLAQLTRAARESAGPVRAIEYANGRLQVRRDATPVVGAAR